MAEKADVCWNQGEGQNVKGEKEEGVWDSQDRDKCKKETKSNGGEEGLRECSLEKWIVTIDGASSFGSIAVVTLGTNPQGHQNQNKQKKGPKQKFPCPRYGGKYQFKDCPQWKNVQALLAKENK